MKKLFSLLAILFAFQFSYAQWSTSGSNTTTTNNVGIGTTSPQEPLSIVNTSSTSVSFLRSIAGGNVGVGAALGQNYFGVYNSSNNTELFGARMRGVASQTWTPGTSEGTALSFSVTANNTTTLNEAMYLDNNGSLGIGTTSPASKLDVESSTNSSWATQIINTGTTNAHGLYVNIGSGSTGVPFRVDVNGTGKLQVSNNGNVGIGTTAPSVKLSVGTSVANPTSGQLLLSGSTSQLFFETTGNSTDNKLWDLISYGNSFNGRVVNDANNASSVWLTVNRNGATVDNVLFPNGNMAI